MTTPPATAARRPGRRRGRARLLPGRQRHTARARARAHACNRPRHAGTHNVITLHLGRRVAFSPRGRERCGHPPLSTTSPGPRRGVAWRPSRGIHADAAAPELGLVQQFDRVLRDRTAAAATGLSDRAALRDAGLLPARSASHSSAAGPLPTGDTHAHADRDRHQRRARAARSSASEDPIGRRDEPRHDRRRGRRRPRRPSRSAGAAGALLRRRRRTGRRSRSSA